MEKSALVNYVELYLLHAQTCGGILLTFTPPESAPSGQFWCIYALIGGVRVKPICISILPKLTNICMHTVLVVVRESKQRPVLLSK